MDAMTKKRNRRKIWIAILCICVPLLLAAAAFGVLCFLNRYEVRLELTGPETVVLEYGEPYVDDGAQGVFLGTIFHRDGIALDVEREGQVDPQTLGTYTVTYSAAYEKWSGSVKRTVQVVDTKAPRLLLRGKPGTYVIPGEHYSEEGYLALDECEGDISDRVHVTEEEGIVRYEVEDSSGNRAYAQRKLVYHDPIGPSITLSGEKNMTLTAGNRFKDPGYTASDNVDGDLTEQVEVSGSVDIYRAGTYEITYTVRDSYGNETSAVRNVRVKAKQQPTKKTPTGKVIYLTFDDGPSAYTPQLLEILKKYDVKATFFVMDTAYVGTIKQIAADGHTLAVHTATHAYKTIYASEEAYFADVQKMASIIKEQTGVETTLLRFPGGSSNTVSRFNPGIMSRLTRAVEDMGYQYFDWNVDSNDAGGAKTAEEVFENVTKGVQKRSVSIVLQHDTKSFSVEAVEKIIIWGLENGYTFLPLDASSPGAHHGVNN